MGTFFLEISMANDNDQNFLEKLKAHPGLRKRFEEILDITENTSGDIVTADEAEGRAIEEVKKLGQEMMREWAVSQHDKQFQKTKDEFSKARVHTKKNSTGKQPLEK